MVGGAYMDTSCPYKSLSIYHSAKMNIKNIFFFVLLNICLGIVAKATPVDFVAIPYYDIHLLAGQLKTFRYSPFENPTGLYFVAGETIRVTVPALQGYQLNLLLVDFGMPAEGERKEKTTVFELKKGDNEFLISHKGLVYVSYYVKDYRKAPKLKLTFHTGRNNGVFNAYHHTNVEWKQMLENAVTDVIDMQGKYIHLTFDVKTLREKGSDCGVEMIRMYDRIILWQQEMLGIDRFDYRTNNHMFGRISWAGPPNANGKGGSFSRTSSIIRPENIRTSNWVIGHEFGHVNQVRPGLKWHGTTEIFNNIQVAWIQYLLRPEGPFRLEHTKTSDGAGQKIHGGSFNWHFNHCIVRQKTLLYNPTVSFTLPYSDNRNPFVRLCPFWQLQIYNELTNLGKSDFYAYISEIIRQTDEQDLTVGELQLNFVRNAYDVMQEDLTDFFTKCGMLRAVDTKIGDYDGNRHLSISQKQVEETVRYTSRYPKPKSPVIHYITMNWVKAFREQLPVQGITGKGIRIESEFCHISHDIWKNVVVFEAYQKDKLRRVSIVGTGTEDNTATIAYFPKGCDQLVAVS